MLRNTSFLAAAAVAFCAQPVFAQDMETAMMAFLAENAASWVNAPIIVDAITAQNAETAGLGASDIEALDQEWRAQVGSADAPVITPVLQNAASDFLREQVASAGGVITEVFIMDAAGLNVAASDVTSDYWQGDEAKFTETFGKGAGAVHVGDVEFDESSQSYQGQISAVIVDDSGAPIGAITIGLNAESLL